jgi:hypothetical protein
MAVAGFGSKAHRDDSGLFELASYVPEGVPQAVAATTPSSVREATTC